MTPGTVLDLPAAICVMGAAASLVWNGWPPDLPRTLQYEGRAYKAHLDYRTKTVKLQVRDLKTNEVNELVFTEDEIKDWRVG